MPTSAAGRASRSEAATSTTSPTAVPPASEASPSPSPIAKGLARDFSVESLDIHLVTPTTFRRLQWAVDVGELQSAETGEAQSAAPDDLLQHDLLREARSVALFDSILVEAVAERASDIHLEQQPGGARVRIRVDGELRRLSNFELSNAELDPIVRLIKVRAMLDISEHRHACGGQFRTVIGGCGYFVRVQTQPTVNGQNAVLRLLPDEPSLQSIEMLGFSQYAQERYRRLLASPGGLVLVVGPTGSGKTTTLYAGLRLLAADERRKVISVEDPVETVCEGIQQIQIDASVGFADATRELVREDPDVILLGEIRDSESALEAIRASQTGHLVLSSLHCNDSVDAVQRLLDLGMHPNSLSSELLAVFAQRLARRICAKCREPAEPKAAVVAEVFPEGLPADFRSFHGRGCEHCGGSGHYGRIAVVEVLPMTRELRRTISAGAMLEDLRSAAARSGLVSLRARALELVRDGVIEFDTLPRFIPIDRLAPSEQ